jgi:hypothetical protein
MRGETGRHTSRGHHPGPPTADRRVGDDEQHVRSRRGAEHKHHTDEGANQYRVHERMLTASAPACRHVSTNETQYPQARARAEIAVYTLRSIRSHPNTPEAPERSGSLVAKDSLLGHQYDVNSESRDRQEGRVLQDQCHRTPWRIGAGTLIRTVRERSPRTYSRLISALSPASASATSYTHRTG